MTEEGYVVHWPIWLVEKKNQAPENILDPQIWSLFPPNIEVKNDKCLKLPSIVNNHGDS